MTLTKKNHYNPCFWTAIWNASYYDRFVRGEERKLKARDQVVAALNVKANKIFTRSVNDIHYDKNLGIAEITKDSAESFAERYHPDKYLEFLHNNSEDDYPVYLDFEDTLTELEKMPPYEVILSTAKNRGIASLEEKAFLGYFILLQLHRSHAIMNSMLEWYANLGRTKFEHFITLKWFLSDPQLLFKSVYPIVERRWIFYSLKKATFPLCDSPILVNKDSIMVAISPKLLLEIKTKISDRENEWKIKRSISKEKLNEFMRRTIGNTFREIIFGDENFLRNWKQTADFKQRVSLINNNRQYNKLVYAKEKEELWLINAYGNKN